MDLSNGLGYAIMIAQVILLDLALGADNSAVIGMAAKNLNHKLRKKAILIGTAGAVIARFVLAVVSTYLMQIPFLKAVGAVILLWIGMGLIAGEDDGEKEIKSSQTLGGAIRTIILADVIMSLDNVLAIVGATDGHLGMLAFGMIISVPIIVFGSTLVLKLMDRFPVAIYVAAMVIGWAAGGMIATDASLGLAEGFKLPIEVALTFLILVAGYVRRRMRQPAAVPVNQSVEFDK